MQEKNSRLKKNAAPLEPRLVEYIGLLYFENILTLYIMAIKTLYKILLSTHSLHKD